jgi:hypothetical protein
VVATCPTDGEQVEHVFSTCFPTPLGERAGVLLDLDGWCPVGGVVCSIQGHGEGGIGSGHCFFGGN